MPRLSVSPSSKPNCSLIGLICVFLGLSATHTHAEIAITVPEQVSLLANTNTQQLSISWLGGAATTFDLIILRTEFNETVFYGTVSVTVNQVSGRHEWNWTSVEPLECTSLSVRIRSRDEQMTSDWSDTQILQGNDLPSNKDTQMYPQDRIVPVGSNTTFCCIVAEGEVFDSINYSSTVMNATRLSRRTYATTVVNQGPSRSTGTNVLCFTRLRLSLMGAVVFVGYPPQPSDFVCETHDLTSAVCLWNKGRDTSLYGRKRRTRYSVNNRDCTDSNPLQQQKECSVPQWEGNWTLVAVNPLGQYSLTDSAELSHRVCPVAPVELSSVVHAWNATVQWQWKYNSYSSLALVCQVELTAAGYKTKRTITGVGLRSAVLSDLHPDEDYSVQIRCGAQQNFWKWGTWSKPISFKTKTDVPDAPDVWMWSNRDGTGQVIWKPLTQRQSHGQITGYDVTFWNPEENRQHTVILSPDTSAVPINLTQMAYFSGDNKVIATVTAKNADGMSQPASVSLRLTDVEPIAVSRAVYTDKGFPLLWQSNASATCSFVVEWHETSCTYDCPVDWIKVPAGNTNVSIESANFQPGVRYTFSLYSCPSDSPELLQRWQGYTEELVPSGSVSLSSSQQGSDILLTWGSIPMVDRRGFLLGYNVYISNGSQLTLLANLSDLETRSYTVKGFSMGSYKFTVKAYTSAGEDTGTTAFITLEPYTDWLILEILASLGILSLLLVIATFICYKKRKWVKKAFYPDIPEPKLPSDWSSAQGPMDVRPSPHSMVHIVEKPEWDSSKEVLVVIPEEDEDDEGQGIGDEPVDTDEPTSLRYYNQVVDERPIRPRFPDSSTSSASSLDSAHTDVTYTGIQTSGSSLVFQLDPQGSSEGHQPQDDHSVSCGGGGYRPQMQPRAPSDDMGLASAEPLLEPQAAFSGGYKPQSSWHFDSPMEAEERGSLAPSLGSPTSIASTQFLLPDGEEHEEEKHQQSSSAATWFTNLLSSTKP
ncbi:LIF receptor subunit alpha a [Amphiprion ocellaris]|uniref:Fibronectin type-III domain-containing protein n=1 Tax=Amphiprion ocellaris TaxID=80972 RepID=A0AAQ6A3K3_AMPOC|nr:LIF receptor subunit alpha a [Amphiprion ocellaris]XP_035801441.2 LIF receptor subunit alpha a [Amphiprion ocellaris]